LKGAEPLMKSSHQKEVNNNLPNLENILNKIFDGIIIINQDKKIVFCNKSFKTIMNIKDLNIIGKQYNDVFYNNNLINKIIEKEGTVEQELTTNNKYLLLKKFSYKSKENNIHTVLILKDVTIQKDSKDQLEKLKESLEMIEELLDNAYYGMAIVDEDGKIVKWNYEKFLGIKEEEVLGKYVQEVIENTRLHIVAKTGKKELCQVQKVKGNYVITSRIPIVKDSKIIGAAGTILFKDLNELKSLAKKLELLEDTLHKYKGELNRMYSAKYSFDDIITENKEMLQLKEIAKRAADTNSTVLIQGESGTGKELFAHAIHNASSRKYGSFVTINCAAIPRELLESELFGYEEGAFTGAKKTGKIGKFELANGGTILLDEIGSMPLEMQAKLLRVLESREFERIGSNNRINLDVRVIASTNEDLEEAVIKGKFRRDLYYRLNVITIEIPPLRQRPEDISKLAQYFINKLSQDLVIRPKKIAYETLNILTMHKWLGNVRELRNVIEMALSLTIGDIIRPEHLPEYLLKDTKIRGDKEDSLTLKDIVAMAEIEAIKRVLEECKGNKTLAAEKLGIHRTALHKKIKSYKLDL
jgi:transcriptional regulator with PAS, ATPase and Fis domain